MTLTDLQSHLLIASNPVPIICTKYWHWYLYLNMMYLYLNWYLDYWYWKAYLFVEYFIKIWSLVFIFFHDPQLYYLFSNIDEFERK